MSKAAPRTARLPRWATRMQAMAYAKVGSTRMNEWLKRNKAKGKLAKLKARKDGAKVIIDLNDIDDLVEDLPRVLAAE